MLSSIREISYPTKSLVYRTYDAVLTPLHIVLGSKKLTYLSPGKWLKEKRRDLLLVVVIASLACLIFSPLLLSTILLKSKNPEHKQLTMLYYRDKRESALLETGFKILRFIPDRESFTLQIAKTSRESFHLTYNWQGKLTKFV